MLEFSGANNWALWECISSKGFTWPKFYCSYIGNNFTNHSCGVDCMKTVEWVPSHWGLYSCVVGPNILFSIDVSFQVLLVSPSLFSDLRQVTLSLCRTFFSVCKWGTNSIHPICFFCKITNSTKGKKSMQSYCGKHKEVCTFSSLLLY